MRRLVLLLSLFFAASAAGQGTAPASSFPGVAWGVDADSVIRAWGEPAARAPISRGLKQLSYWVESEIPPRGYYILVHPRLGVVIAGYRAEFETDDECRTAAAAALLEIEASFPALEWDGERPEPAPLCAGEWPRGLTALDAGSGTRVSLRLDPDGTALTADAISEPGYQWIGGRGSRGENRKSNP